jgi:hypothetical protein
MYFKCLPFVEENIPHETCLSTALQLLAQVFMVLNPCTFLMALCAFKKEKKHNPLVCFFSLHTLKYLVSCTNKIISCTYNVNYANWRKLEILNFINLMHVSFWECIFTKQKIRFGNTDIMNYTQLFMRDLTPLQHYIFLK